MIVFPNCKINIGLWITDRLTDGYHSLQTVMYPVPMHDILEILLGDDKTSLYQSGIVVEGSMEQNLCYKAWLLLNRKYNIPPVQMHLHKMIPLGAGLGGGSSDAAFALRLLDNLFCLNLSRQELSEFATELGMDCPFFIHNKPMLATSKGEVLQEIDLNLSGYYLVIVKPALHISTAKAYSLITPHKRSISILNQVMEPVSQWKNFLTNDFEEALIELHPEIGTIKSNLYTQGAIYASMSGSGSAVFGLFDNKPPQVSFPHCVVFSTLLGSNP